MKIRAYCVWRMAYCAVLLSACSPSRLLITARVTDAETGGPLSGALVMVRSSEMLAAADSQGITPGIEAGPRDTLLATCPGYLDELAPVNGRADTLRLALYQDLPRAVAGLVRSTSGFGIDSAVVALQGTAQAAATLADGSFFLADFPAGPQLLTITCPGFPAESLPVSARAGETTRVEFSLRDTANEGTLAGLVTGRGTSAPVSDAVLRLPDIGRETRSGPDGSYSFGRVPVGEHIISVQASGFAPDSVRCRVTRGWTVSVDILLEPTR